MMTHKIDFEIGKKYYIDEKQYGKKHIVTLKHFWKETMIYCVVENEEGGKWETMLYRLSEINLKELTIK